MIVLACLNSFWPILDFLDFGAPVQTLEKSWNISQIFARFWGKSGNSKEISSLLHRSKEGSGYGSKGGVHESKKIKIGQNVFKQPKTIIESRFGTPPVGTGSVPAPPSGVPQTPSGGPSGAPQGPLGPLTLWLPTIYHTWVCCADFLVIFSDFKVFSFPLSG